MNIIICMILLSGVGAILVLGQSYNDAKNVNANVCGTNTILQQQPPQLPRLKRFVSEDTTHLKEWGWLVLLENVTTSESLVGSLINSQWVLTKAEKAKLMQTAKCGTLTDLQRRMVIKTIIHPDFNQSTRSNDLALVKLDRPIKYSKLTVPVCLPNEDSEYTGEDAYMPYFDADDARWSNVLLKKRQQQLIMYSSESCTDLFAQADSCNSRFNYTGQVCASSPATFVYRSNLGAPICHFDAGDGKWYAIGVTSYGWQLSGLGDYTSGSRVSAYYNWIVDTIRFN